MLNLAATEASGAARHRTHILSLALPCQVAGNRPPDAWEFVPGRTR
ncbi:hypothetical protein KDW54_00410 [Burkholderia ambifaria]|nr:hypothetical protein [Burkholderia ambifaria]MBR8180844.1 hypothetical protein [Burkholderia ambifaria]